MSTILVVAVLSLLLGLQPITTDLYLPALPALSVGLSAGMAQAQLTLSALLLAFGASQLIWGPLSDRFGRRPILLTGLFIYVVASAAGALAHNINWLIIWRTAQGAALGAAVMCARAILRDLYAPADGARVMSQALSGLALFACISAPLGSFLTEHLGWRYALLAPSVFGAAGMALIMWRFEESLAPAARRTVSFKALSANWMAIFRNPSFWAFSSLTVTSYAGLFTFLATSSFVFTGVLGVTNTQYGLIMLSNSLAYLSGTFLCRRWLARFGLRGAVARAGILSLTGGSVMAMLSMSGVIGVWAILLPQYLFMIGHGIHQPCGQSGVVGPFPHAAGVASALNGFLMMAGAFAMGHWLGIHMDGTVAPLTLGVWFWSVLIALSAWTLVQHHGDPIVQVASRA